MSTDTSFSSKVDISYNTPSLSDLLENDKPWNKHRSNADKVATYYAGSEFQNYSDRIDDCSELLDFWLISDATDGLGKLKLNAARFCRVRHCPICQWRRSLMWKAKAYNLLPEVIEVYPNYRWLFVTFTVKNCLITELRSTLQWMHKSFKRLTKLKRFPAIGWIKSVEVTRSKDGLAHPHFHCLFMVLPSYFGANYIKQAEWVNIWQQCLQIKYNPVLDIKAIKKGSSPATLVPELLKYCTKESDLTSDREWFLELTRQMHKTRAIATGGVLKDYLRKLECRPVELANNEYEKASDERHYYFWWEQEDKKYKLVN